MKLWFDVEDFFMHARLHARPTGIQRLAFEVYRAIRHAPGVDVGFVRHNIRGGGFYVVEWSELAAVNDWITNFPLRKEPKKAPERPLLGDGAPNIALRLPPEIRRPLAQAARSQLQVFRSTAELARSLFLRLAERAGAQPRPKESYLGADLSSVATPGDIFCCFGALWISSYADRVARTKAELGLQFAMLVYDLIPAVKPEFQPSSQIVPFTDFMRTCLPLADHVLTISEATTKDVVKWTERENIFLQMPPRSIPIGTEIKCASGAPLPDGLMPGSYALFVSTIEVRKNHLQIFRIWRRMLEEMPRDHVPDLVFAGRLGWMVDDLMRAMENTNFLDGKIILVEQPDDMVLDSLYRGCKFTIFTSFYEGWGLPVSESLAHGKTAIISNRASLPEAGKEFCVYVDPDNTTDAYEIVRRVVEDPTIIGKLEARIAATYRPTPWSETAAAILDIIVDEPRGADQERIMDLMSGAVMAASR